MLPALSTAPAPTTTTPSTSAWLWLSGLLACLLLVGHQWPATRIQAPAQRAATSQPAPAPRPAAAPASDRQYATTRAVAAAL